VKRKWSPYSKPTRPSKPLETFQDDRPILSFTLSPYEVVEFTPEQREVLHSATRCELTDIECDGSSEIPGDSYAHLVFRTSEERKNPNYEEELIVYKQKYIEYREELRWWNSEKKKRDAIEAEKKQAKELREYERLKAKYGDQP